MIGPVDLARLVPGDWVDQTLLVLDVEQRGTDRPFTVLTLGNRTGRLTTAPVWPEERRRVAGIARGHVVHVTGEVTTWREARQLRLTSIRLLPPDEIDAAGLLPSVGAEELGDAWEQLDAWRGAIFSPRIKAVLTLFFDDPHFRRRFERCPASIGGHHALAGGLLQHTAEVAAIARAIARVMCADQDLVLAGALLHDIGKVDAYAFDRGFEHTDLGRLLGHVALGALRLERVVRGAASLPCTEDELALLHHFILSHHGQLEFGAAVRPLTLEAEILHFADDASAKARSFREALADAALFAGASRVSARPLWQLDGRRVMRWELRPDAARDDRRATASGKNEAATQPRD